jgi:hypothetical protein
MTRTEVEQIAPKGTAWLFSKGRGVSLFYGPGTHQLTDCLGKIEFDDGIPPCDGMELATVVNGTWVWHDVRCMGYKDPALCNRCRRLPQTPEDEEVDDWIRPDTDGPGCPFFR